MLRDQVNEDAIETSVVGYSDDDTVIRRAEDGTCVIANHDRYQSTEARRRDLDTLISDVSKFIHRRWRPLTAAGIDAMFVEEGNFYIVPAVTRETENVLMGR